ncbi:helix-turn-helix domain-containing protein [Flavobacterium branchiophilum]|uniref:Probable transcriptional regulator, AraC family n=1 Tax=Flavobacterium branchiophilum (strain FL-15) TaxID=1034807 RepID=G2Z4K4_FLABF|nr:helix-turn-helix domain-containing protein [Flavobacterium branchiophilum]CCB68479.1 Probable transcriptional regulator, AraC family [Flavobacterium branchiophilum FL-15]
MYLYNSKKLPVFSIFHFEDISFWKNIKKSNFYSIIFTESGIGNICIDCQKRHIHHKTAVFLYPYQKVSWDFETDKIIKGIIIQFHPDFFCIDIHAKEIGCQGLLFNNPYYNTICTLESVDFIQIKGIIAQMLQEMEQPNVASIEMVSSLLKIILIHAVRLKLKSQTIEQINKPAIANDIEILISQNYLLHHDLNFYASVLNISKSTLNRKCNQIFGRSFQKILIDKIIIESKKKLYLSNDSIKKISLEMGFEDPLYFSRFFKNNTTVSPLEFRKNIKGTFLETLSI